MCLIDSMFKPLPSSCKDPNDDRTCVLWLFAAAKRPAELTPQRISTTNSKIVSVVLVLCLSSHEREGLDPLGLCFGVLEVL